jgi:hypothetical protein
MATFGRFENGAAEPIETYEGDYMRSQNSHVRIFRGGQFLDSDQFSDLVVTVRLGKAQSVREIKKETKDDANEMGISTGKHPATGIRNKSTK